MSAEAMRSALAAADAFAAAQGSGAIAGDETFDTALITCAVTDAAAALADAQALVAEHGAEVTLEWPDVDHGPLGLTLRPGEPGWEPTDGDPSLSLPALEQRGSRTRWEHELLAGAAGDLAGEPATATITLPKTAWRAEAEAASGRTVWMGRTLDGFGRWLLRADWEEAARVLDGGGLAVLLDRWPEPAPVVLSEHCVVGPADHALAAAAPDALAAALAEDDRGDELGTWRAARLDPPGRLADPTWHRLRGIATQAAAAALADEWDAQRRIARPRRDRPVEYVLAAAPPDLADPAEGAAVRSLARWVSDDYTASRLDVAREIAAELVADPLATTPAPGQVRNAAGLAYRVVVRAKVQAALEKQHELEEAFLKVDERAAGIRTEIAAHVDQTVARVLTTSLAITIASLVSDRFRGTATIVIACAAAVYAWVAALQLWKLTANDARERLGAARTFLVAGRRRLEPSLAGDLDEKLTAWETQLRRRITGSAIGLLVLGVLVIVAGVIAG